MILNWLFWGLSALLTGLLIILCPLSPLWALLLLPGLYLALGTAYMMGLLLISLFLPKAEEQSHKPWCRWVIVYTLRWIFWLFGFRIHFTGAERLPTDRPFLVVCNHRSNFDPLITLAAMHPWKMAFVSKPENFRIPVAGPFMRSASFLAIDRENARKAATTIHRAADAITKGGLVMGIYPEGTRSKTGELLEFRDGAFKIAKLAQCPVAVMTICYHGRRVELHTLALLDETYVKENRTNAISDHARELIAADLSKSTP